jgi:hypothetical protein
MHARRKAAKTSRLSALTASMPSGLQLSLCFCLCSEAMPLWTRQDWSRSPSHRLVTVRRAIAGISASAVAVKWKGRPRAASCSAMRLRSGEAELTAFPPIRHETEPHEAEDHHRPGGRLGNGGYQGASGKGFARGTAGKARVLDRGEVRII